MNLKTSNIHRIIIAVLTFIVYSNTLFLHYALDDRMVILESKPTIQGGWQSVKTIFTEDTFSGYFGKQNSVVAGGRYRPMSQLTYMIETQLFGGKIKNQIGDLDDYYNLHNTENEEYFYKTPLPFVNHLMNVVYYILLCLLIYEVLSKIFTVFNGKSLFNSLPFLAVILFAVHPIHTEVVANVKGRDEIFAMLGCFLSVWLSLKYIDTKKIHLLALSLLSFTFAIFSKENAVTFLAVIPLCLFFYEKEKKFSDYLITVAPIFLGTVFFIAVRTKVLGSLMPPDLTNNILNNPYLNSTGLQRIATVILTWGIYLKLLFFPHPLTHDYYPFQIEITDFTNPLVWLVALFFIAISVYSILKLKNKTVASFSILYFIITFSITSNLLFNVGTFMNERFVFMPSLGFAILVAFGFYLLLNSKNKLLNNSVLGVYIIITVLFGVKSFTRNFVWYDDISLFTTDVKTSANSIKCNISAGGSYLRLWKKNHKEKDKKSAYHYLERALELDPKAYNAYILLGELACLDEDYVLAEKAAYNATLMNSEDKHALNILEISRKGKKNKEVDAARSLLDEGKVDEAWQEVNRVLSNDPENIMAKNLKGNVLGRGYGKIDEAITIFKEITDADSTFSSAWENLGICYAIKHDFRNSERCFLRALELSPENKNIRDNLQKMYYDAGETEKAEKLK